MSQETKPVSPAVNVLCQQVLQRFLIEREQLTKIAFETDGIDPASGYQLDVFNFVYVKPAIDPAPTPQPE